MYSVGGPGGAGDMGVPPQSVIVTRVVHDRPEKIEFTFRKMTKEEREAALLKDGDILYYPRIVF